MQCPKGFVIPDNPLDLRVLFVPGSVSGCAKSCEIAGYFTDNESTTLRLLMIVASVIGLPLIAMVLWTWLSSKLRMEKQYLIFCFVALSAFFSLWMIIGSGSTKCHDNATETDQSDGFSICVLQGAAIVYCLLAISFAWFISCFELFHRLVWKKSIRHHQKRVRIHLCCIFLLPAFPIVYASIRKMFGYNRILPFCMFAATAPLNVDFAFLYVPMFLATVAGALLLLIVMWHTIRSTKASLVGVQGSASNGMHDLASQHKQSVQMMGLEIPPPTNEPISNRGTIFSTFGSIKLLRRSTSEGGTQSSNSRTQSSYCRWFSTLMRKLRYIRTLLSFFSFYLVLWLTLIGYKTYDYFYFDKVTQSVTEWTNCVFQNFNGIEDVSWLSICGEKASHHVSLSLAVWFVLCISGHSIFITVIYLPAVYESFLLFLKTRSFAQVQEKSGSIKKNSLKSSGKGNNSKQLMSGANDIHEEEIPRGQSRLAQLLHGQVVSPPSGNHQANNTRTAGSNGDGGSELNGHPPTKSLSIRRASRTDDIPMGNKNAGTFSFDSLRITILTD